MRNIATDQRNGEKVGSGRLKLFSGLALRRCRRRRWPPPSGWQYRWCASPRRRKIQASSRARSGGSKRYCARPPHGKSSRPPTTPAWVPPMVAAPAVRSGRRRVPKPPSRPSRLAAEAGATTHDPVAPATTAAVAGGARAHRSSDSARLRPSRSDYRVPGHRACTARAAAAERQDAAEAPAAAPATTVTPATAETPRRQPVPSRRPARRCRDAGAPVSSIRSPCRSRRCWRARRSMPSADAEERARCARRLL